MSVIVFILPHGTEDGDIFSKEIEPHLVEALEQEIDHFECDQTKEDIDLNLKRIKEKDPDVIVLGSSMKEKTIQAYTRPFLTARSTLRGSDAAKPLIYHYVNTSGVDEDEIITYCDEYLQSIGELC
jgi:DNA-binding NarL/FixJ family response regulator